MKFHRQLLLAATLITTGASAFAQAAIDHNKALAGNVTPGDSAGYPINLNQPGHYVLKSNLIVPANTTGIIVNADNVTIDLNGFSIIGAINCTRNATSYAVTCTAGTGWGVADQNHGLVLRNGRIQGFHIGMNFVNGVGEDLVLSENKYSVQTPQHANNKGMPRLTRSSISLSEIGLVSSVQGVVVTDSTFSRNGQAVSANWGPDTFSNSAVVSNQMGFALGEIGLRGVFMRDNKTNNSATVYAY